MAQVIILGAAAAIPSIERDYAHLAVQVNDQLILVDCGGNPMVRLAQMGLDWRQIKDIIITHFHADHAANLPNLIVGMWLSGRQTPLAIHGLKPTIRKINQLLDVFEWQTWRDLFPINFNEIQEGELNPIIESDALKVVTSPTQHSIPSVGLRFESKESGKTVTYSCDTEPCQAVIHLAQDAHVLIHEATGLHPGHSSAQQAGEIAHQARANHLYLIHYPSPPGADPGELTRQARQAFQGPVTLAQEGMRISF
jgi:ribonuclease Z